MAEPVKPAIDYVKLPIPIQEPEPDLVSLAQVVRQLKQAVEELQKAVFRGQND